MKALMPISLIFLVACSSPDSPAPESRDPDPSVFDDLTGTLDRAGSVEDTLRDSAADRRRQLEEAEGR